MHRSGTGQAVKRFAHGVAIFLAGAALGFFVLVWQLPNYIMNTLMGRVAAMAENGQLAPPLPDDQARSIVLPSPDLAYVICVYDLAKGPLTVSFDPPDLPYWSVAAYAANTDNFAVINDRNAGGIRSLTVMSARQAVGPPPAGAHVIRSPTERGVVLFRGLMPERDAALLKRIQAAVSCRTR
jgi:uncharacterized membrane protein